jgi:hypothetical protein
MGYARFRLAQQQKKQSTDQSAKGLLTILWVTQEIIKQQAPNPTWPGHFDRPKLLDLRWDEDTLLQSEMEENFRLLVCENPAKNRERLISAPVSKRASLKPLGKEKSGKGGLFRRVRKLFMSSK